MSGLGHRNSMIALGSPSLTHIGSGSGSAISGNSRLDEYSNATKRGASASTNSPRSAVSRQNSTSPVKADDARNPAATANAAVTNSAPAITTHQETTTATTSLSSPSIDEQPLTHNPPGQPLQKVSHAYRDLVLDDASPEPEPLVVHPDNTTELSGGGSIVSDGTAVAGSGSPMEHLPAAGELVTGSAEIHNAASVVLSKQPAEGVSRAPANAVVEGGGLDPNPTLVEDTRLPQAVPDDQRDQQPDGQVVGGVAADKKQQQQQQRVTSQNFYTGPRATGTTPTPPPAAATANDATQDTVSGTQTLTPTDLTSFSFRQDTPAASHLSSTNAAPDTPLEATTTTPTRHTNDTTTTIPPPHAVPLSRESTQDIWHSAASSEADLDISSPTSSDIGPLDTVASPADNMNEPLRLKLATTDLSESSTPRPKSSLSNTLQEFDGSRSTIKLTNGIDSANGAKQECKGQSSPTKTTTEQGKASNLTGLLKPASAAVVSPSSPATDFHPATSASPTSIRDHFSSFSSPDSSLIFERSVQEFPSVGDLSPHPHNGSVGLASMNKIPMHHTSDDFIPPVLDASTEVLTMAGNGGLSIEDVEVLSVHSGNGGLRTWSFSDAAHAGKDGHAPFSRKESFASSVSSSVWNGNEPATSPIGHGGMGLSVFSPSHAAAVRSPSGSALSSLANCGMPFKEEGMHSTGNYKPIHKPSVTSLKTPAPHSSLRKDGRVLSFCSFADLVTSEHAAQFASTGGAGSGSSTVTSPSSNGGVAAPGSPIGLTLDDVPTSNNNRLKSSSSKYSLLALSEGGVDANDLVAEGLDVASLGETLRRNTGIIASHS